MNQPQVTLRQATLDDVHQLATMNRELIQDENSSNPMSLEQLQERMKQFISGDWQGLIFMHQEVAVGYTLLQHRDAEDGSAARVVFVRQFYISRNHRRMGIGRSALNEIIRTECPRGSTLELGVLEANPAGRRFWEAVGFTPAYTTFRCKEG